MRLWPRSEKGRAIVLAFAAGAALLCASLVNFLHHNEYPHVRPEVGLIVAGLVAIAAVVAIFYGAQRQWGRSFLEGLLAALFIDLNTDSLALACAAGVAVALLTWWKRMSLTGPMALVGVVVIATTLIGLGGNPHWIKVEKGAGQTGAAAAGKPAIVHIILDEHIGLEGLPDDAEGRRLRDELRSFYLANGFAVYGGAYSEHYETVNAIPELLNFGTAAALPASKDGVKTGATKYLSSLVGQGYGLTIFQSDYVDYCTGAIFVKCVTYGSSSLRPTLAVPMEVGDRAKLVIAKFVTLSAIATGGLDAWNLAARAFNGIELRAPVYEPNAGQSSTIGTMEVLDELKQQMNSIEGGQAIFAHLLLPHFPFVVGEDCRYLPWSAWEGRYLHSTIQSRRNGYSDQIRCTERQLASMLDAISRSRAAANAVVIIHGDHGSRIVQVKPYAFNFGRISDADMIAGFSTLFAVRAPGVAAAYSNERLPLVPLFRDFAASGFRSAPHPTPPGKHTVFLADKDWKPVRRVPLPASWTKGFDRPAEGH